jgi:hypothetical protein
VRPERFELPAYCSGGNRSIQLSYGRTFVILHEGIRMQFQIACQSVGCKPAVPEAPMSGA